MFIDGWTFSVITLIVVCLSLSLWAYLYPNRTIFRSFLKVSAIYLAVACYVAVFLMTGGSIEIGDKYMIIAYM